MVFDDGLPPTRELLPSAARGGEYASSSSRAPVGAFDHLMAVKSEALQLPDEQRDGDGVQKWPDGSVYRGQFKEDKAHGYGTFEHVDGGVYAGEWMNDKAHGEG